MKSNSWFRRLLTAYLPLFYLVVVFLGFAFFMTMSQMMNTQMKESSETYAKHIMQTVESSLQSINQIIIREIHNNPDIQTFLYGQNDPTSNEYLINSQLAEKLNSLIIDFPLIDSIYYYRVSDQKTLSASGLLPIDYFGDLPFIRELEEGHVPFGWTGGRSYKLIARDAHEKQVISLVKTVSPLSTADGFLVVNVPTKVLESMIRGMGTQNVSYIAFHDQNGELLFTAGEDTGYELTVLHSAATGWEVRSGLQGEYNYKFIFDFYYGWIILGLAAVAIATVMIIYFARRYTSPIDSMLKQFMYYSKSKFQDLPDFINDQPRFIENMVDHLIGVANQYGNVHKENLHFKRKQFFIEWVGGERLLDKETWEKEMAEIGGSTAYSLRSVALVEINQYGKLCEDYSYRDQYLFKYIIESVFREIGTELKVHIWSEWLEPERLTVLMELEHEEPDSHELTLGLCERTRDWIDQNLDYSVTVGIGSATSEPTLVPSSLNEAEKALVDKPVEGNVTLAFWNMQTGEKNVSLDYLQRVKDIADNFKRRNSSWENEMLLFMADIKMNLKSRQDVENMLHYFLFHVSNVFTELPAPYQEFWEKSVIHLREVLQQFEDHETLNEHFIQQMREVAQQIEKLRGARYNQTLIRHVKEYIEENSHNPDLSLTLLSERFQMNQSYMSRLFKEEFGQNFVDYLAQIRVFRSKQLLKETDEAIAGIALKVGYVYKFSFNRVFKKVVGVTPGEYRKQSVQSGDDPL